MSGSLIFVATRESALAGTSEVSTEGSIVLLIGLLWAPVTHKSTTHSELNRQPDSVNLAT